MSLIGKEYTTGGGNVFIVTGEIGRWVEVEIADGTKLDIPRRVFEQFVEYGHYKELETT